MLLLPANMLGEIVTKVCLTQPINVRATTATCAGLFVWIWWISYLGWNLPLLFAFFKTLGSGSRRGDSGELQLVLALYFARTITRRILRRAARHTKRIAIYWTQALTYLFTDFLFLFRHTRGVRSKSSRALRLKLQHSHFLVARCYNLSLARPYL